MEKKKKSNIISLIDKKKEKEKEKEKEIVARIVEMSNKLGW